MGAAMPADEAYDLEQREKDPAAVAMGRKGGRIGGAARAANMSPEERAASAKQAAAARWARVAAERESLGADEEGAELAGRQPKPFVLSLTPDEALMITGARGQGGQQTLHRRLVGQLANGNLTIELDDRRFGELVRYMTRYGSGGFQGRLKNAFQRSLGDLLGMRPI
jgi:hypothetical protein